MRTIQGDIAKAIELVLEVCLACDIEMVNMGDWTLDDYNKHAAPYQEAIDRIQQTGSLFGTDPKIIKRAVETLEHMAKTFSEHKV